MKERPILFSGAMVRALLDGSKTQTRRVVKVQPDFSIIKAEYQDPGLWEFRKRFVMYEADDPRYEHAMYRKTERGDPDLPVYQYRSAFGEPGDRLWVRETWSSDFANNYPHERVWYAADNDRRHEIHVSDGVRGIYSPESHEHVPFRWRPSIHMPHWASRITLEVTGVCIERLQDISETDALAEGIRQHDQKNGWVNECTLADGKRHFDASAYGMFQQVWADINGAESWDANPWVWVVEFKRVTP